jgi:hypothetical protein
MFGRDRVAAEIRIFVTEQLPLERCCSVPGQFQKKIIIRIDVFQNFVANETCGNTGSTM